MRIIICLLYLCIPVTALMAQSTSDKFTQSVGAYGVMVYYPETMTSLVQGEIMLFVNRNVHGNAIIITPPQALDEAWGISPTITDKAVVMEQFVDAVSGRFADLVMVTDVVDDVRIGGYDGIERVVRYDNRHAFIYGFDTPAGIFIARLVTDVADEAPLLQVMSNIVKAMDISPTARDLPDGVVGRIARTPDVRMSERFSSSDGVITYQVPLGWVRDRNGEDVFADSQATHDSLSANFDIPDSGTAVAFLPAQEMVDLGLSATMAYDVIRQFSDLISPNSVSVNIMTYTNLPYTAYVLMIDVSILPFLYFVAIEPENSDRVVFLAFVTKNFERDEPYLIAILNSIRAVTSPTN